MPYATKAQMRTRYGVKSVQDWSDLDGTGADDDARINESLAGADAEIHLHVAQRYATPLTLTANSDSAKLIAMIAVRLAGHSLYSARGMQDSGDGNKLAADRAWAMGYLRQIALGIIQIDSPLAGHVRPPYPAGESYPPTL